MNSHERLIGESGGVLLCCRLFSYYYMHEFPGIVRLYVCVYLRVYYKYIHKCMCVI